MPILETKQYKLLTVDYEGKDFLFSSKFIFQFTGINATIRERTFLDFKGMNAKVFLGLKIQKQNTKMD